MESANGKQDAGPHKTDTCLVVSAVRERDGQVATIQWSIDGLGIVYEAEVLLEGLPERELHEGSRAARSSPSQSKETQKRMLRALFLAREVAGASQGQEHRKQLPGEFTNALRKLSQHLALGGETGKWKITMNGECFLRPIQMPLIYGNASGSGVICPTPTVHGNYNMPGKSVSSEWGLSSAVKLWPTPTATDTKGHPAEKRLQERMQESSRGVRLSEELARRGQPGQLNPEWVEWLMGWPIGHTALEPLETAKYREWLQQHSPFSNDDETT
ncbi:hypothetical protein [Burkholderia pseudomallei]|uniref:hypothetical protein n=1 Tax=Burkholderia pseudomallei TaxID=28450 RepID=UPI00190FF823